MSILFLRAATLACLVLCAPAIADERPNALPGGDARSYGYGGARAFDTSGVIDLTAPQSATPRSAPPERTAPEPRRTAPEAPPPAQPHNEGQGQGQGQGTERGIASWYGAPFAGRPTASGEIFDQANWSAAHRTLPFGSLVRVVNLENNREILVRVTDRGPFVGGRVIDLSESAARVLGFVDRGVTPVEIHYMSGPSPRRPGGLLVADGRAAPSAVPAAGPSAPLRPEPAAPGANDAYVVQIGAFAAIENAHRARDAAAGAGDVAVEACETPRGRLYRVRLGGFANSAAAEAARRDVAELGFPGAIVLAD